MGREWSRAIALLLAAACIALPACGAHGDAQPPPWNATSRQVQGGLPREFRPSVTFPPLTTPATFPSLTPFPTVTVPSKGAIPTWPPAAPQGPAARTTPVPAPARPSATTPTPAATPPATTPATPSPSGTPAPAPAPAPDGGGGGLPGVGDGLAVHLAALLALSAAGALLAAAARGEGRVQGRDQGGPSPETTLFEDGPPGGGGPPFPAALASRYEGARFLHEGGIARVYAARRRSDGAPVAVKVPLRGDEQTGKSFLREIRAWEALSHPGIVRVYGANILPVPYVEMEFLPRSLADIPVPVDPAESLRIVGKVAEALGYAHDRGVLHRDLKPANILLSAGGEPKIADWGLSRDEKAPPQSTIHGFSLAFSAPEQLDPGRFGAASRETDIYQLGIVWYWLVTGKLPFPSGDVGEALRSRLEGRVLPPSAHVPAAAPLDRAILRCLAPGREDRYRDARDLLAEIREIGRRVRAGEAAGDAGTPGQGD
ncbi:MAG: serine/threonine-protein kinase [Methanolinea sp.]|nr:serine/threonine-protein kinase [Methanolinea sp.]